MRQIKWRIFFFWCVDGTLPQWFISTIYMRKVQNLALIVSLMSTYCCSSNIEWVAFRTEYNCLQTQQLNFTHMYIDDVPFINKQYFENNLSQRFPEISDMKDSNSFLLGYFTLGDRDGHYI